MLITTLQQSRPLDWEEFWNWPKRSVDSIRDWWHYGLIDGKMRSVA
jgi:hypothetical protein